MMLPYWAVQFQVNHQWRMSLKIVKVPMRAHPYNKISYVDMMTVTGTDSVTSLKTVGPIHLFQMANFLAALQGQSGS